MKPRTPTIERLGRIERDYHLHLGTEDLESFQKIIDGALESYERIGEMIEPQPQPHYGDRSGYRPEAADNPLGAWYWKASIKGMSGGLLTGKRVAIKDNICVAGLPMMNGSSVLEGYVPESDATVVTRILDAGGEIAGKAVCEHLCFGGSSFTSDTGPVHNPHAPTRTTGGSSSGCAALVAAGEVDMAIGGDQGGSIRIPASWCGICGLKPTYGLVPYTGVSPIELTLDHIGPMAASVSDVALLLQVVAGADGLDPRQSQVQTGSYVEVLNQGVRGLNVGVVREGFSWPNRSEDDVDDAVWAAARNLSQAGARVNEISIPIHRDGIHIWTAIATEGAFATMVRGNSMGTGWKGQYNLSLLDMFARGRQSRGADLSDPVKLVILLGQYLQSEYHGRYYAKAQNLARRLAAAYDEALSTVDLLVMPTLPMKATMLPAEDATREDKIALALGMHHNVCPFDVSGHPSITVPCSESNGLPIGIMFVGRHWEDEVVLRGAREIERLNGSGQELLYSGGVKAERNHDDH